MNTAEQTLRNWVWGTVGIVASIALSSAAMADQKDTQQKKALPIEDVQRFTAAISQIKSFYVEDVTDQELFNNAIRGMLKGLDPHSAYLDQDEFKDLTAATRGEFSGLGIEVTMEHDLIKVVTPIDDTPAQKAGVKAGDLIISLDDTPVKGMSLREAVKKMRGKKGSPMVLTIIREGEKEPLKLTVVRDVIQVKSVKNKLLQSNYGYLRISHFQVPTATNINKAVAELKKQSKGPLRGVVLDLRNNPGGLLDSAIAVSDTFLDSNTLKNNKLIVYTKGRIPGASFKAKATPGDALKGIPMVILINEGSASAAEIVAGALQDHNRAILLGKKTFGKGSVQTVLPLDKKTGVKLTTALYYTPAGRSIQAKGIKPDVVVEDYDMSKVKAKNNGFDFIKEANLTNHLKNKAANDENAKDNKTNAIITDNDYQLYEAINLLKGLHALNKAGRTHQLTAND